MGEHVPELKASRRRVIACLAACQGIPTDQLEPGGTAHGLLKKLVALHELNAKRKDILR